MEIPDKLKGLTRKAEDAAVEHKAQIQQALGKAAAAADKRTAGKYHERIQTAEEKAESMIDKLGQDGHAQDPPTKPDSPSNPNP